MSDAFVLPVRDDSADGVAPAEPDAEGVPWSKYW
jgi:hypothetical protein